MQSTSELIDLDDAIRLDRERNLANHQKHLNPRLASLLSLIKADAPLIRAKGCRYWDSDGNEYIDFLCGFAALCVGHNDERILDALEKVKDMPNLVEGVSILAGALAHNLACVSPGDLDRVYFASSGAEVVDAAIRLARGATGRRKLVACHNGFHGRTLGALSVMDRPEYTQPFAPLLPGVTFVPFGDADSLDAALRERDVAAFIVEPIQGEAGMIVPPDGYLRRAREVCSRYGTLFVADEIQTGLGRTGRMFAVDHEDVVPDVLLLGKALGGGVMPLSALLTTDAWWQAADGASARTPFHTSTFGGNTRACAAGLATLELLLRERLPERAAATGEYLMGRLRDLRSRQPLIADVRGRGLLIGIEFAPATSGVASLVTAGLLNRLSQEYLSGIVMMELLGGYRVMTAFTLNNQNVLRLAPPLNVDFETIDYVVDSLDRTLGAIGSFPRAALRSISQMIRARLA